MSLQHCTLMFLCWDVETCIFHVSLRTSAAPISLTSLHTSFDHGLQPLHPLVFWFTLQTRVELGVAHPKSYQPKKSFKKSDFESVLNLMSLLDQRLVTRMIWWSNKLRKASHLALRRASRPRFTRLGVPSMFKKEAVTPSCKREHLLVDVWNIYYTLMTRWLISMYFLSGCGGTQGNWCETMLRHCGCCEYWYAKGSMCPRSWSTSMP